MGRAAFGEAKERQVPTPAFRHVDWTRSTSKAGSWLRGTEFGAVAAGGGRTPDQPRKREPAWRSGGVVGTITSQPASRSWLTGPRHRLFSIGVRPASSRRLTKSAGTCLTLVNSLAGGETDASKRVKSVSGGCAGCGP